MDGAIGPSKSSVHGFPLIFLLLLYLVVLGHGPRRGKLGTQHIFFIVDSPRYCGFCVPEEKKGMGLQACWSAL